MSNTSKYGVVFFNFGGACIARLFVALFSLRKYYDGPVHVFLAKDPWNEICSADIQKFAEIEWFSLEKLAKRHLKCVLKPFLFEKSPYDVTLMADADVLFQASPAELFPMFEKSGLLVTKFSNWNTDGGRMRVRIARFRSQFTENEWNIISSADPQVGKIAAINIGIVGMSKVAESYESTRKRWHDLTMSAANTHMADEHALQVLYPLVSHTLVGPEWNESCVFPGCKSYDEAKIIHYHGNKESEPTRPSSQRWLRALEELAKTHKVRGLFEYVCWAGDSLLNNIRRAKILRSV